MSQTASPSAGHAYGLVRVCQVWEVPPLERLRGQGASNASSGRRREAWADTALSDAELTEHIRRLIQQSPFLGEGYRKV